MKIQYSRFWRVVAFCMAVVLSLSVLSACKSGSSGNLQPSSAQPDGSGATPKRTVDPNFDPSAYLIGLVIDEDEGIMSKVAAHGFLRTAENLGYPCKLYSAPTSAEAAVLVDQAIEDGCKGLLIWADSQEMIEGATRAKAAGIYTVVPYWPMAEGIADANLKVDPSDYAPEAARILCETIKKRGATEGTIFVTGADEFQPIVQYFEEKVKNDYPSYQVVAYEGASDQASVNAFVLAHPEIIGVLALEEGSGLIWNNACNDVQAELLAAMATPTPASESDDGTSAKSSPTATPTPTPTPEPTPEDDSYKRYANILLLDYTQENLRLVRRGVVTGLIGRPFYDSTAQSVAVLDRLMRGLPTQTEVMLNTPILRKDNVAKYEGIMEEVTEWFEITPSPTATPTPSPSATLAPSTTPEATASSEDAASSSPESSASADE